MESYEARGIVGEIQSLLTKRANGKASQLDYEKLIDWERRAHELLTADVSDFRIITGEHNCNGALEAKDGFIPRTSKEIAACDAYEYSVRMPQHFRREPVERVEVLEQLKVVDREGIPLQKVPVRRYIAHSASYTARGRQVHDSCTSGPEAFYVDSEGAVQPLGASSALLARLLEAKAAE